MEAILPLLALQTPSFAPVDEPAINLEDPSKQKAVSSVCFLPNEHDGDSSTELNNVPQTNSNDDQEEEKGNEEDSDDEFDFSTSVCQTLTREISRQKQSRGEDSINRVDAIAFSQSILSNRKLASCHVDGRAYIWDLSRHNIIHEFGSSERKPGLSLRRLESSMMLYQTRDALGTITLHDTLQEMATTIEWQTESRTFCAAAPCTQNLHLVAMPSPKEAHVTIRDCRMSPLERPAFCFHAAVGKSEEDDPTKTRPWGMLTSLAMSMTETREMVACGMENGSVLLHDLAMISSSKTRVASLSLGTDPVLSLDMVPSTISTKDNDSSKFEALVLAAGLAGDAAEMEESKDAEKGRLAILKATAEMEPRNDDHPEPNWNWTMRQRARVGVGKDGTAVKGKSGAAICRFRPNGRLVAVGGWDRRLRIYDRSREVSPLAILKGHSGSVDAMDWASDADQSGLIATGASDGVIQVWRCDFEKQK